MWVSRQNCNFFLLPGSDGRVVEWTVADGSTRVVQGDGHGSQVNGLTRAGGSHLTTVGIDDSLKSFDQNTASYIPGVSTKFKSQPRGLAHKGNLTAITTVNSIILVRNIPNRIFQGIFLHISLTDEPR